MPRFFFNVYDHDHKPDPEGTDLPDALAAQEEAIILAGYLLQDHAAKVLTCKDWHMSVTDVSGAIVCRLGLSVIANPVAQAQASSVYSLERLSASRS